MEAKAKKTAINVKVVSFGDYLPKAKEMIDKGESTRSLRDLCISLLFSENGWPQKKIEAIQFKGETKFVVEV